MSNLKVPIAINKNVPVHAVFYFSIETPHIIKNVLMKVWEKLNEKTFLSYKNQFCQRSKQ